MAPAFRKAERAFAIFGLIMFVLIALLVISLIKDGDRRSWRPLSDEPPRPFGLFSGSTGR